MKKTIIIFTIGVAAISSAVLYHRNGWLASSDSQASVHRGTSSEGNAITNDNAATTETRQSNASDTPAKAKQKLTKAESALSNDLNDNDHDRSSSAVKSQQKAGLTGLANTSSSLGNAGNHSQRPSFYDNIVRKSYDRYFQIAELSDAETNAVTKILREEADRQDGVLHSSTTLSITQQQQQYDQIKKDTQQEIVAVLSPDQAALLTEYRANKGQRNMADQAAALGGQSGVSFSPQEVDYVTKTLHDRGVIYGGREVFTTTPEQYDAITQLDTNALATMSQKLTPAQIAVLKTVLASRMKKQE